MKRTGTILRQFSVLADLCVRDAIAETKHRLGMEFPSGADCPTYVNLELVDRCPLHCRMCDIWKHDGKDELSIDEWRGILDNLKRWLGAFRFTLTGGEPFMKSGIWELIDYASRLGLPIVIVTSGYYLTPRNLERLLDTNITELVISIDDISSTEHNGVRGVPGLFERVWSAISYLSTRKRPFLVATNSVIMRSNIGRIAQFPKVLQDVGVDRVLFQPVQGGFGRSQTDIFLSDLWPLDSLAVEYAMEALKRSKQEWGSVIANTIEELDSFQAYFVEGAKWERPIGCDCPRKLLSLAANGDVRIGVHDRGTVGNVRHTPPKEIWSSESAKSEREHRDGCAECLLNCSRTYGRSEVVRYALSYISKRLELLM